ncbi:hypothetical protein MWMV18_MWMV18_03601 [Acinetobacter calcoaceticus]|nr:hypothetical protein MWMV18_MWMV18_03601 [Acinetobacter calcoaceticus]
MFKKIILLSTFFLTNNLFANVNWNYVGADANSSYYIGDIDTDKNDNLKIVSFKKVLKKQFLVDKVTINSNTFKPNETLLLNAGDSFIVQEKYNCVDRTFGVFTNTPFVEGRGLIVGLSSSYNPIGMVKIKKSSIQDKIFKLACQ